MRIVSRRKKMIANFVLIVSTSIIPGDLEYVGNFVSCEQAHLYMKLNIPNVTESRCVLEEYMHLPEDFDSKRRELHVHDACKITRTCE